MAKGKSTWEQLEEVFLNQPGTEVRIDLARSGYRVVLTGNNLHGWATHGRMKQAVKAALRNVWGDDES